MPGVVITTSARSGATPSEPNSSGQAFIVGLADRGPSDKPVLVRGLADFESKFGGRTSYSFLYDTVKSFFDEGGTQAHIARVVGPAAIKATYKVEDTTTVPVPVIKLIATSPGAWGNKLRVLSGANADGKPFVQVSYLESPSGNPTPVSSGAGTYEEIVSAINSDGNGYVTAQLLDTSGANGTVAEKSEAPFSEGADDRASITKGEHVKALSLFPDTLGDGAVLVVDHPNKDIYADVVKHVASNNRIALFFHDLHDAKLSDMKSFLDAADSDAAGIFTPWVKTMDTNGVIREIPPVGYVAAARARAHAVVGPWRPPAGEIAASKTITSLATEYSRADADALDDARVNVIRRIGSSIRLYGWRSLSKDAANFGHLNARDLLNRVVVESSKRLEQFVFAPVDSRGHLLSTINSELVGILEPIRLAGGLYELTNDEGEPLDDGYLVDTSSAVNTMESLSKNEVNARVALRVSPFGALITLEITKVGLRQGLS